MRDWRADLTRRIVARRLDPTLHIATIEELAQHLDDQYRSLLEQGVGATEAERRVLAELDDEALDRELARAERASPAPPPALGARRRGLARGLAQDLRYAVRALRTNRGFTAVAVLTLALGIGATTAIFSLVHAVMLRDLPYADADRLVRVWESNPARGWPTFSASHPNYLDWRAETRALASLAATTGEGFNLTSPQGAEVLRGTRVTANFLPTLGVPVALGRNFLDEEDRPRGDVRVVLLSDGFWRRRFNADPSIVGRQIPLDDQPYLVIGVLPPAFAYGTPDVLVPLAPDPGRSRGDHRLTVIGRLRDGVTLDQAHAEMAGIAARLATQYPESNEGWSVRLATAYDWLIPENVRTSLLVLLGAVGVVLLIACANVANLLLARATARQKEIAVRIALGAERWRIVQQLLAESLLLALVAGVAGIGLAFAGTQLLVAYGPASVPRLNEVAVDRTVVAFALAIAVTTAFVFGLLPAVRASRGGPSEALQEASRGSTGGAGRERWRGLLTVAEVALSVALLIGAGLLLRSFQRLQQVDPGFNTAPLMMMRVALTSAGYPDAASRHAFNQRLLADIAALPGIVATAASTGLPMAGGNTATEMAVPGRAARAGAPESADWRLITPGYFKAMGIPLRGREFAWTDGKAARDTTIISEELARLHWPGEDPIGRTVILGSFGNRARTIIGVAGDVRSLGLDTDPRPTVYYSMAEYLSNPISVVWRSEGDPAAHVNAIRAIVQRLDASVPIYDVRTLDEVVWASFAPRRFNMYLLTVFAGVALLLAAIGLFGVMAYLVSQRTREIGVRLALGAGWHDVVRLVVGRGLALALSGAAIGLLAAFWLSRVMESLLFSVSATDPGTFVAVPLLLILVAAAACYVPARRAMRVDPVTALRAE